MLTAQLGNAAGIFGCDEHKVLSYGVGMELGDVLQTAEIPKLQSSTHQGADLEKEELLEVFMRAWRLVLRDGRFRSHDWTVKVEPNTVFFPERLRERVRWAHPGSSGLFVLSCNRYGPPSMLRAVEALSRDAVLGYESGRDRCEEHRAEHKDLGENEFIQWCLNLLGVGSTYYSDMVADDACWPGSCDSAEKVAFHPFSSVGGYLRCWEQANDAALAKKWHLDTMTVQDDEIFGSGVDVGA